MPPDRVDDPYLIEKLQREADDIFLWCLEGLKRLLKNKYRFTDEQFEQYKRIENKKAVDIYTIKKSAISAAEKKTKIQAVKEWKIEQMQKILSAEQFEKWHSDYLRAEQNRRKAK